MNLTEMIGLVFLIVWPFVGVYLSIRAYNGDDS